MKKKKNMKDKEPSVADEILAALAEFTDALETGEVTAHLRKRQAKFDVAAANHKPAKRKKKSRTSPSENGTKKR